MSSAANETKKFLLKSSDGELFEAEELVVMQSQTIKHLIEDNCGNAVIPLPNVTAKVLTKVMEYCKRHANDCNAGPSIFRDFELKKFDKEFAYVLDQEMLLDLMLAANYLNINGLLELACAAVADMIKGKSTEEVRETFGIENDFTPEEEKAVLEEEQVWPPKHFC